MHTGARLLGLGAAESSSGFCPTSLGRLARGDSCRSMNGRSARTLEGDAKTPSTKPSMLRPQRKPSNSFDNTIERNIESRNESHEKWCIAQGAWSEQLRHYPFHRARGSATSLPSFHTLASGGEAPFRPAEEECPSSAWRGRPELYPCWSYESKPYESTLETAETTSDAYSHPYGTVEYSKNPRYAASSSCQYTAPYSPTLYRGSTDNADVEEQYGHTPQHSRHFKHSSVWENLTDEMGTHPTESYPTSDGDQSKAAIPTLSSLEAEANPRPTLPPILSGHSSPLSVASLVNPLPDDQAFTSLSPPSLPPLQSITPPLCKESDSKSPSPTSTESYGPNAKWIPRQEVLSRLQTKLVRRIRAKKNQY